MGLSSDRLIMLVQRASKHFPIRQGHVTPHVLNIDLPVPNTSPTHYITKRKRFNETEKAIKQHQIQMSCVLGLPERVDSFQLKRPSSEKGSKTTYQHYQDSKKQLKGLSQMKADRFKSKYWEKKKIQQTRSAYLVKSPMGSISPKKGHSSTSMIVMNSPPKEGSSMTPGSVTFSIKTAQGKRKRINTASYLSELQEKR